MPSAAAALLGLLLLVSGCGGGSNPLPAAGPDEPAPSTSRLLVDGQPVLAGYTIDVTRRDSEPLAYDPELVPDGPLPRYRYRVVIGADDLGLFLDFELDEAEAPVFREGSDRPQASAVGKFVANGFGIGGLTLYRAVIDGFSIGNPADEIRGDCTEPLFYIEGVFTRLDTQMEGAILVQGNQDEPLDLVHCGSRTVRVEFSAPVR